MMANLRLVLAVEVAPGNQHTSKHSSPRLWELLDGLASELSALADPRRCRFRQRAGDARSRAAAPALSVQVAPDQEGVKRAVERAMGEQDWQDAGARWQGKDGRLQLDGWSRHRRIVILRRRTGRALALD